MHKKQCINCGKEFDANRPTAKYCTNSCRTKANLKRRQNEDAENRKKRELEIIADKKRIAAEARKLKKMQQKH